MPIARGERRGDARWWSRERESERKKNEARLFFFLLLLALPRPRPLLCSRAENDGASALKHVASCGSNASLGGGAKRVPFLAVFVAVATFRPLRPRPLERRKGEPRAKGEEEPAKGAFFPEEESQRRVLLLSAIVFLAERGDAIAAAEGRGQKEEEERRRRRRRQRSLRCSFGAILPFITLLPAAKSSGRRRRR